MNRRCCASARVAALGCLMALLGACATPAPRPPPAAATVPPPPSTTPAVQPQASSAAKGPVPVVEESPWPRLRRSFAMGGCDYSPAVREAARTFTADPRRFSASLKQAMPFLLLVVDELELRGLPGEFAMLPYVESAYQPLAARGNRASGMWQLTPGTARSVGVTITSDYDGRLDPIESTSAALDLIERYQREFGDWRLADLAYNRGASRVRGLLGSRDARTLTAPQLAKLSFRRTVHQHLARLIALACIIEDPRRFNVKLPEPDADDRLQAVPLQAGMDLRLAAELARLDAADFDRWNAAYRHRRMPVDSPHRLLLPATHVADFLAAANAIPVELWSDWREQRVTRSRGIGDWATQAGIPVAVLAMANALDTDATVDASMILLLPAPAPERTSADPPDRSAATHTVVAGDTLGRIAHHYAIPLDTLKRWNPKAAGILHPGQRLRVGD